MTLFASMPSETVSSFQRLRRSRPAPASRTSETAICTVTSAWRSTPRDVEWISFPVSNSGNGRRNAEARPNSMLETSDTPSAKRKTRTSMVACSNRGIPAGAMETKRRSKSKANPQLSHAAGCPREEQVRDVGTRDKQDSQDSAEQDPGSDAGILDLSVAERTHGERYLVTKLGRNVIEGLLEEWFHRRRRLLDGDAGLEPRKGPQNHLPRIGPAIRGAIESGRNKNVFVAEVGHFELRRKDTHDDRGPTVEGDGTPGKIAVTGEAGTPQPIGDERDTRGLRPVFVAREIAAEERLDAEGWQECGFDERALQTDRVPLGEIA